MYFFVYLVITAVYPGVFTGWQ